jgi:hypothetical protein
MIGEKHHTEIFSLPQIAVQKSTWMVGKMISKRAFKNGSSRPKNTTRSDQTSMDASILCYKYNNNKYWCIYTNN